MKKISPFLWFDKEAGEAAELYVSTFGASRIVSRSTMGDTPSGAVEIIVAELAGQTFKLMSAGPYFKFTPAISFTVACSSKAEVDAAWARLSEGGSTFLELGSYTFSERYGWTSDRYGLSWQLMYRPQSQARQKITPTLMFVGANCGKAEEAISHYFSFFGGSGLGDVMRYGEGEEPNKAGTLRHVSFSLAGQGFAAMDSAQDHRFTFSEAISFEVECADQAEVDHYWRMSADPSAEQCGWLKDRYGVSWQIVPAALQRMMGDSDPARVQRVSKAFLAMKKFDIAALEAAYAG
ncbi:MAG TPA: VOC family protein [Rectinemataceae bacterium]|nr:VOC family protein [Rectinemataceae bacterium]